MSEKSWKNALLLALAARPDTTVWIQNSGRVKSARGSWVGLMPTGAADIGGVVRVGECGLFIQVETKVAGRKQTQEQARWAEMCSRRGAVYLLALYDDRRDLGANLREVLTSLETAVAKKKLSLAR